MAALVPVAQTLFAGFSTMQAELAQAFWAYPWAPVQAARVLAEVGDDPRRCPTLNNLRSFAGTAPVTKASGKAHRVSACRVRKLADACHW